MPAPGAYFTRSNYPQLADLEGKLLEAWRTRKDFSHYMERAAVFLESISER